MKLYRVIVPVNGIDVAATFYERLLEMTGERVSTGRHYLTTGEVILALVDPRADGQDIEAQPNQEHIYFSTHDLEAAHARAEHLGASEGPGPIEIRPWGERSFYLADPTGNPLCVVEAGTEFTSGWVT